MLRVIAILILLGSFHGSLHAQVEDNEFLDSSFLYKKIEDFSNRRKFTKMLYGLVFRPVNPKPQQPEGPKKEKKKTVIKPVKYSQFEGKIIRDIHVVTYDPFGYNPKDTSLKPDNFFLKVGNGAHVKTWPMKIKNILIIKKYDTFDSLRVKESERLIRSQSFVREVYLYPVKTKGDSVDIYINVYDVWSIIATGAATTSWFNVDARDKNFLGTGHTFQGYYKQNYTNGKNSYSGNYIIPNIYNTYISSSLRYVADENRNYFQSLTLSRPFYSVFTSWAGGIALQRSLTRELLIGVDSTSFEQRYRYNSQDFWVGKSWQIFKGPSEERRSTSLIASARYLRRNYLERAIEEIDTLRLHANDLFYLVGGGLSRRQYKQDNYIFRYGFVEDVPIGRSYSLVGGYQIRDLIPRWYAGGRVYMANYHNWGYFNMYFEYGTFIRNKRTEEGCFTTGINYFSNIIRVGRWKLRQFIKPQYTIGFNRKSYESLSLNNEAGIRGFNSIGLSGKERLTLTFQLQSYAPWNILGFRFGPYAICSFGMLGSEKSGFSKSPLYSSFGIGLLLKNDYLILNTFQISVAYYPSIPGVKNHVIKMNPVKTTDFGFRGFDISQPSVIGYN